MKNIGGTDSNEVVQRQTTSMVALQWPNTSNERLGEGLWKKVLATHE